MKKIAGLLAVGLMAVQIFTAHVFAAPQDEGMSYLERACKEGLQLKNFRSDIVFEVKTPIADLAGAMVLDVYQEDSFRFKAASDLTLTGMDGKTQKLSMQQYAEEKADGLLIYANTGGKWVKSFIPCGKRNEEGLKDTAAVMQLIKSASVKSQSADMAAVDVVVDMKKVSEIVLAGFDQAVMTNETAKPGKGTAAAVDRKAMRESFQQMMTQMDDIAYTVTIDKKSNHIVHVDADLTESLQRGMNAVISEMAVSDKQKASMKLFLQNAEVRMREDISLHNQLEPFAIPQDIVINAAEQTAHPLAS